MKLYPLWWHMMRCLEAEKSHILSLKAMRLLDKLCLLPNTQIKQECIVMGIKFPNPIGLAAGLDKNGDYFSSLSKFGFGFIEIGTVTPKPQMGNARPRLFRLPASQAIINRMGFNNKGVDYLVERVKATKYTGVLGINIGKNAATPLDNAAEDYLYCLERVYPYAHYITINISSPNTLGLRDLQNKTHLTHLFSALKSAQEKLAKCYSRYVPMVIKIAPDLTDVQLIEIASLLLQYEMDGVIATNTTIRRALVLNEVSAQEKGGLSGAPLLTAANHVLARLSTLLAGKIAIIGVGGIMDATSAASKFSLGASLIQLYTGFIYRGPNLLRNCLPANVVHRPTV